MFYSPPPRQELAVRGEHRHPQVHRCSTQPSEKPFGRRPLKFFKNLRSARCAQERPPPMQIDLETGAILEDGTEEELAEWVQLYRATQGRWTPCEPHDETCPF